MLLIAIDFNNGRYYAYTFNPETQLFSTIMDRDSLPFTKRLASFTQKWIEKTCPQPPIPLDLTPSPEEPA